MVIPSGTFTQTQRVVSIPTAPNSTTVLVLRATQQTDVLQGKRPKIICIDELDKMPKQFQDKFLNFMESGHIKMDRRQYDFKIKGAKVFAACNEITRLSKPLQSRFRRLHLPRYTEEQFLEVSAKVLPKLKIAHATAHYIFNRIIILISMDFFTTTLIYQNISTIHHVYSF